MTYDPQKLKISFSKQDGILIGEAVNYTGYKIDCIEVEYGKFAKDLPPISLKTTRTRYIRDGETARVFHKTFFSKPIRITKATVSPDGAVPYRVIIGHDFNINSTREYSGACPAHVHSSNDSRKQQVGSEIDDAVKLAAAMSIFTLPPLGCAIPIGLVVGWLCLGRSMGCFVTTAAYGDAQHPMVKTFRALRDEVLVNYKAGRAFIGWYNEHGPKMAAAIENKPARMFACRCVLTPLAHLVKVLRSNESILITGRPKAKQAVNEAKLLPNMPLASAKTALG